MARLVSAVLRPIVHRVARFIHRCVEDVVAPSFARQAGELAEVRQDLEQKVDDQASVLRQEVERLRQSVAALGRRLEEEAQRLGAVQGSVEEVSKRLAALDDLVARVGWLQHMAEETSLGIDQATQDLVRLHWRLEGQEGAAKGRAAPELPEQEAA